MQRQVGTTSQIIQVGLGVTGLAYGTAGLTCYYKRNTASASVSVSLVTMTLGTWASGGFKEVDSTNLPGLYEFGIPNAALLTGADLLAVGFNGAGLRGITVQLELTAVNNQDGVRYGMTALPNAAAGAANGLTISATGYVVLKKNKAYSNFMIYLVAASDGVTPVTGATVAGTVSLDGGAFGAIANSPTEVGQGLYVVDFATTDTNANSGFFRFTASGGSGAAQLVIVPIYFQP